jgi:hypothetical protein
MSQPSGQSFEPKHVGKFYWPLLAYTTHETIGRFIRDSTTSEYEYARHARIDLVGSVSSNQGSELAAQLKLTTLPSTKVPDTREEDAMDFPSSNRK